MMHSILFPPRMAVQLLEIPGPLAEQILQVKQDGIGLILITADWKKEK